MRGEKLRGVFSGLGFESVGSVLGSGNVVFSSAESDCAALESKIQHGLSTELGIGGGTLIRTRAELRALIESDPFSGLTHSRETYLMVTFLKEANHPALGTEPPPALADQVKILGYDERIRAILAVMDNSVPGTPNHMAWLDRTFGKENTTRTWATVQKVFAKL
ncbi:hypothetical protein NRB20_63700 [Nocardia sp. RB20]|uniref:DUF1697 domain-containing protein n=2 Tax=Nocardia macrotermitis TaxID=2585198 RepID=A0A7K0DBT4_9NOCA|nr:hypothetical protein [Nocardia macrotermitis]